MQANCPAHQAQIKATRNCLKLITNDNEGDMERPIDIVRRAVRLRLSAWEQQATSRMTSRKTDVNTVPLIVANRSSAPIRPSVRPLGFSGTSHSDRFQVNRKHTLYPTTNRVLHSAVR